MKAEEFYEQQIRTLELMHACKPKIALTSAIKSRIINDGGSVMKVENPINNNIAIIVY